ncbi:hypothetical protein BJX62DRAFT_241511 [Aspergillus germanicus]
MSPLKKKLHAGHEIIQYLTKRIKRHRPESHPDISHAGRFEKLPPELIDIIANFSDRQSIFALRSTCTYINNSTLHYFESHHSVAAKVTTVKVWTHDYFGLGFIWERRPNHICCKDVLCRGPAHTLSQSPIWAPHSICGSFEKLPVELMEIIAQSLNHGALLAFRITVTILPDARTHLDFVRNHLNTISTDLSRTSLENIQKLVEGQEIARSIHTIIVKPQDMTSIWVKSGERAKAAKTRYTKPSLGKGFTWRRLESGFIDLDQRVVTAWQETLCRLPRCLSFSVNPKAKSPSLNNSRGCERETYSADGRLIAADDLAIVLWFISEWSRLDKSVSLDVCLDDFYLASPSPTTAAGRGTYGLPAQSATVFGTPLVHRFHDSTAEVPDRFLALLPRNLASIELLIIRDKGHGDVLQYLLSEAPQLRKLETGNVPAYTFSGLKLTASGRSTAHSSSRRSSCIESTAGVEGTSTIFSTC